LKAIFWQFYWLPTGIFLFQAGKQFGNLHSQRAGEKKNVPVSDAMNSTFNPGNHIAPHIQSF